MPLAATDGSGVTASGAEIIVVPKNWSVAAPDVVARRVTTVVLLSAKGVG